jgi:hypothetical protein
VEHSREFVKDRFPTLTSIRGVGIGNFAQNGRRITPLPEHLEIRPHITLEFGLRYEATSIARDSNLQDLNGISNILSVRDEIFTTDLVGRRIPSWGLSSSIPCLPITRKQFWRDLASSCCSASLNGSQQFRPTPGRHVEPQGRRQNLGKSRSCIAHDVLYGNLPLLLPLLSFRPKTGKPMPAALPRSRPGARLLQEVLEETLAHQPTSTI